MPIITDLDKIRVEIGDTDPNFPILSSDELQYFLDKNSGSISRASLDAAKTILFKLAQESDETVGLFQIKGRAAAESYRQALELYIKNVSLNPLYSNAGAYAAGISVADAAAYQTIDSPIRTFEF